MHISFFELLCIIFYYMFSFSYISESCGAFDEDENDKNESTLLVVIGFIFLAIFAPFYFPIELAIDLNKHLKHKAAKEKTDVKISIKNQNNTE